MTDRSPHHEQFPESPRAAYVYYKDLYYSSGESGAIVIALQKLFDQLPAAIDLTIDAVYDTAFMEYELAVEPRIAGEMLAMLPFSRIGPKLEGSDCPPEALQQWYADATRGMLQLTKDTHSEICYESGKGTVRHMACEHSSICPRLFLERFLTDDAFIANFDDDRYVRNAPRTMQLARYKLQVAKDNRVSLPSFCDTTLQKYEEGCEQYIAYLMSLMSDDIDNMSL
jgi:hypothetical protein